MCVITGKCGFKVIGKLVSNNIVVNASVHLLLNVRDCAPDFAMKALEYRNDFDAVEHGKVCSCAPCSPFSDCCQLATPVNAEVQKMAKIGIFRRQRATE